MLAMSNSATAQIMIPRTKTVNIDLTLFGSIALSGKFG
jgi:hypothetical protein